MVSTVSPLVWVLTIVGLAVLIVLDLAVIARRRRRVTTRDAVIWIGVYIGIAALFAIGLFLWSPGSRGGEFVAGYVTEYSLSVDNLFVFMLIMSRFAVPPDTEDAALYIGIVLSLLLRAIFIFAGAAAISAFSWIFFVLGAFLIFTAIRLVTQGENDDGDFRENAVIRLLRRMLPLSTDYDGPRFTTRVDGERARPDGIAAPLLHHREAADADRAPELRAGGHPRVHRGQAGLRGAA
jgi:tellurite resistance protein TerC